MMDLFDFAHSRWSDPKTSKEAAESIPVTAQALVVLRSYASDVPLLDVEAYRLAGFPSHACDGQRCSDLRKQGFIQRTGGRAKTPSGKSGHLCVITETGRRFLASKGGAL
jgi:hypothetical protein